MVLAPTFKLNAPEATPLVMGVTDTPFTVIDRLALACALVGVTVTLVVALLTVAV